MVTRPHFQGAALFALVAGAALLVSGCTSQAQESAQTKNPRLVPAIVPKAKPAANAKSLANEKALAKDGKTADVAAPEPATPAKSYTVVPAPALGSSAPPEIAAAYAAAMKKAAVAPPPASFKVADHPRVELETPRGKMIFELDAVHAPLNTKSFVYLASKGFYKNTRFHRQDDLTGDGKGMIIQGGDPLSADPRTYQFAGGGGPGYEVPLEVSELGHDQFVIAAARSNEPDSAGSQFYITQGEPHFLDGKYTVFGKIVDGKDVAAKLEKGDKLLAVKVLEAPQAKSATKAP